MDGFYSNFSNIVVAILLLLTICVFIVGHVVKWLLEKWFK